MTYEIAYTCENENMCEINHEGKFIVRNYTEDQAGLDIRKEDVVQARNGWYYTSQEIET